MDTNNNQDVWRAQLHPGTREGIVNQIMNMLKRHRPVWDQEGLHQLQKIVQMFEEKNFIAATSESDYLRKITIKMFVMETKSPGCMVNSIRSSLDNITSSLEMLTLETKPHGTMANNMTLN
ncbi:unnamed protein product [Lathyrus sativus]|nr:unnamed protein product [Lathyrus sativus]